MLSSVWLLHGGTIHTLDPSRPSAEAIAVRDDRIVAVGSAAEVERLRGPGTRMIDLRGATVFPGFIDAHAHVEGLGKAGRILKLQGTRTLGEVVERVRAASLAGEHSGASAWIEGRGWDQNDWPGQAFPTWEDLEGATARPVALRRVDGHAVWVNRAALAVAGITPATSDPEGGKLLRFPDGSPTGVFVDNAMDLVTAAIPRADENERMARLRAAMRDMAAAGLTAAGEMGADDELIAAYRRLGEEEGLTTRIAVYLSDDDSLLARWWEKGPELGSYGGFLSVQGVKFYADGALGSRGAALFEDYSDDPGNRGLLLQSEERLGPAVDRSRAAGFQVAVHAIGDRANRMVLDVFARSPKATAVLPARSRVEHVQVLEAADVPRFASVKVIASMQPTHATSDMPWAEARLGPARVRYAYAWRTLLDAGARLALGSDFPVESHRPLLGIYAAVTRSDTEGKPAGGWRPEQRLTVEEAVRGFTLDAAYSFGWEESTGSLVAGKYADLVVLSRDLYAAPPREILDTRVLFTMAGGRVTHRADGW